MGNYLVGTECSKCGTPFEANLFNLMNGNTKSCGCLRVKTCSKVGKTNKTHGLTKTRTYKSWLSMLQRCENPLASNYTLYGAKGIRVCQAWHYFPYFLEDMGNRPIGKTLDRINNNEGYNPDNCKWSTYKEQANNRNQRNQWTGSL